MPLKNITKDNLILLLFFTYALVTRGQYLVQNFPNVNGLNLLGVVFFATVVYLKIEESAHQ